MINIPEIERLARAATPGVFHRYNPATVLEMTQLIRELAWVLNNTVQTVELLQYDHNTCVGDEVVAMAKSILEKARLAGVEVE